MSNIRSTLATVWRIAAPYFRSEDRWAGCALLAAVITTELAIVGITVLLNQWNSRFYNALQERDWNAFVSELAFFSVLAAVLFWLADRLYPPFARWFGTNAPLSIGGSMSLGCFALLNDSITEFYDKAPVETRIVVME